MSDAFNIVDCDFLTSTTRPPPSCIRHDHHHHTDRCYVVLHHVINHSIIHLLLSQVRADIVTVDPKAQEDSRASSPQRTGMSFILFVHLAVLHFVLTMSQRPSRTCQPSGSQQKTQRLVKAQRTLRRQPMRLLHHLPYRPRTPTGIPTTLPDLTALLT